MIVALAGGTGAAGLKLAERIGMDGGVIITDISPGMLAQAEKGATARGLTNVTTRVMDAEALEFHHRAFDLVTCSFGVMFFPDTRRALAEAFQVAGSGGKGKKAAIAALAAAERHMDVEPCPALQFHQPVRSRMRRQSSRIVAMIPWSAKL